MKFIVKLFPEITIKSRPVRKRFIQRLQSNLQIILQRIEPKIKVRGLWDRVDIDCPPEADALYEEIVMALGDTPGIANIIEVQEYPLENLDQVLGIVKNVWSERLIGKRFVVRVKRSGQHDFTSSEMERYIGAGLLQQTEVLKVDLHTPEVTVNLEVKGDTVFVVERRIDGLGGYPQGSQEPVVSLISGGFDSIVASYLTMKRGAKTHFVFFNLGGAAHEAGVKQVSYYLWKKFGSSARVKFISVPFEEVVGEILQNVDHSHMGVVLKRMMHRAAERVAVKIKAEAMITGESIAQVSSQTLTNLGVIDRVTEGLVLRPLITYDKQDIIDLATKIGAYEFAACMPEYCGVISDRPTVRAQLKRVVEEEQNFNFDVLEQALEKTCVTSIDKIPEELKEQRPFTSKQQLQVNDVVVDVRASGEQQKKPLNLPGVDIVMVPFFQINKQFLSFDQSRNYLLYCEKGVMSQLHALHIKDQGFENVGVYRPKS
ncbi:tRNA uracil 4-sulfurtransferase ThiI [Candidatus Njordibacter sp. Uisw_039]|jgi:thiamine biosynthesis protein ThiI|uniref:tRNA uracil 4-sulfurtransferase ThiI n=1 Tax=Candidatus Njordibacter sp. Uisw_039 TaxID=3230972 RepID=UPI003D50289F